MKKITQILIFLITLLVPTSISLASEKKITHKQEIEDLLNKTSSKKKAPGAKEIFIYNPNLPAPTNPNDIGDRPDEPSNSEILDADTENLLIRPNFENAELDNLINFVAQLTKINVIPTKDTQNVKVSLNIRTDLDKKDVWEVFLTVVEMVGFTINKAGNVYRVLRQDAKRTEPLPAYINVPAHTLPDSDQSIRFVTFLRNIQASEVEGLLKGMLGPGGDIVRQDNVNGYILTDKCHNIKAAMTIINELDNTGLREEVAVIPLKKNDASDVKKLLEEMTKSAGDRNNNAIVARLLGKTQESTEYFSSTTKIIAEDRSNSLILLGNQKSIKKIEEFIAKYIEREEPQVDSPIHRYQLEYSDAQNMKTLLDDIVNSQTDSGTEKFGGVRMGGKYFKKMRFEVDKESNSLLVSCIDKKDWKMLKQTIKQLDTPQPQLVIETLVVDIDLQDGKELGGQMRMPKSDQPFSNIGWQAAAMAPVVTAGDSPNKSLAGDLGNILNNLTQGSAAFAISKISGGAWALFNIVNHNFNTSLVDNSFMTIANRVSSTFSVGESRRIVSAVYSGQTGNSNSYETKPVATSYTYTPQINSDGLVNLNIDISLNEFTASSGGADTTNKSIKTTLACADGQVLVLGGYAKTKITEGLTDGMPILSSIPILGWLLKYKTRRVSKVYTFFFICPTVVKPRTTPGVDPYTRMKLHRARKDVADSALTSATQDPIHNLFFNPTKENYFHKVDDFASARFQPSSVDLAHDPYYNPGIKDKNRLDFQDEYESNLTVQQLIKDELPSLEEKRTQQAEVVKPSKKTRTKQKHAPLKQSAEKPVQKEIVAQVDARPETSTFADAFSPHDESAHKLKLPSYSTEKRLRLKELLAATPQSSTTQKNDSGPALESFSTQRSAIKELIKPPSSAIAQSTQVHMAPERTFINAIPTKSAEIQELISQQQERREKLKQTLSFGDKTQEQTAAPLTTHRNNLKKLLASYDQSTKPIHVAQNERTIQPVKDAK